MDADVGGSRHLPEVQRGRELIAPGSRATRRRSVPTLRHAAAWGTSLVLAGCGGPAPAVERDETLAGMPRLEPAPLPSRVRAAGDVLHPVVVGARGEVVVITADREGASFVLLTDDALPRGFGRLGEGPGELRIPQPLLVDDTVLVGYDMSSARVMVFDRVTGAIRREFRPREPVVPYLRGPDGTLLATRLDRGAELPALIDLASGRVRSGVAPGDTAAGNLFAGELDRPGYEGNAAVIGRWQGGTLVANGMSYRMVLYDGQGRVARRIDRNLPPRRLSAREVERELARLKGTPMGSTPARLDQSRRRLETMPERWFTHLSAPREDARGRLWVLVEHGDSIVADVYADDTLLGSTPVECPGYAGRWDLRDTWLVLLCEPEDPASLEDAEVRRYRIAG